MTRARLFRLSGLLVAAFLVWRLADYTMAAERLDGPLRAVVTRVIDGDTLEVEAELWFGVVQRTAVRVRGIDTPEIKGRCAAERERAEAATDRVKTLVEGTRVTLGWITPDKYAGRVDAKVTLADGRDLAAILIADGHARPYQGGRRQGWC